MHIIQAQKPQSQSSSAIGVHLSRSDQPDSGGAALPPPVPVVGKLVVKGKFEFKSVSYITISIVFDLSLNSVLYRKVC